VPSPRSNAVLPAIGRSCVLAEVELIDKHLLLPLT
jgi:hypothetical protein